MAYRVEMTDDGLPEIVDAAGRSIGRALTKGDGDAICDELNGSADLRQRVLDDVTDAIEQAFEGAAA